MKLIYTGINTIVNKKQVVRREYSYIKPEVFDILMANGFIRYDGLWIKPQWTWPVFFAGLANGRVNV